MKNIIFLIGFALFFSCEENNVEVLDKDNLLIGNWTNAVYKNEKTTFSRVNSLPKDNYGFSFQKNGAYLENTSGWCGTPPISFFNVEGNYQLENNLITIFKQNRAIAYRIVSLTETNLVLERELTAQEIEHRKLIDLFNEISELAYSKTCSNASEWLFVGYGSKACGGFQGYLPYHKNIDTFAFLEKVATYNQLEKTYNLNWNVVSDCALVAAPTSVSCKNSYPVLNY